MSKKQKQIIMTLKGGYIKLPIEDIHDFNQKLNRGAGKNKSKKGKGSYERNPKYKISLE